MWIYGQADGKLGRNGTIVGCGYSGNGAGKNNPAMQSVANEGPIPQGVYAIGSPYDSVQHGPFALRLSPDAANQMFGRDGFLMHGDSIESPGCASKGCIVMPRAMRETVWNSGDRELRVFPFSPAVEAMAVSDPELGL
jgi:hypothetical protein